MATINAGIPIPHGMTAGELIRELSGFPSEATVDLYISQGDRPFDPTTKSIKLQFNTSTQSERFNANVIPCPACQAVFSVMNGKPIGSITFFMRDAQRCVSAHEDSCEYKGRETPTHEDWAAAEGLRNWGLNNG